MKYLFLFTIFSIIACSKKTHVDPIYTEEEFTKLTHELESVNPTGENAIPFFEYSSKVNKIKSKVFKYNKLRFYAVGFDTVSDAKDEAIRLKQYWSKDYMFDQVEGEPVLEDYVITQFKAINPSRSVQRKVKIIETEHTSHSTH